LAVPEFHHLRRTNGGVKDNFPECAKISRNSGLLYGISADVQVSNRRWSAETE
jgi:hypothetical protein